VSATNPRVTRTWTHHWILTWVHAPVVLYVDCVTTKKDKQCSLKLLVASTCDDLPDVINCQFRSLPQHLWDPCIFCCQTKSLEFTVLWNEPIARALRYGPWYQGNHTVLPTTHSQTIPAFTAQPHSITTLWLVLIAPIHGRMARLSRTGWLVTYWDWFTSVTGS